MSVSEDYEVTPESRPDVIEYNPTDINSEQWELRKKAYPQIRKETYFKFLVNSVKVGVHEKASKIWEKGSLYLNLQVNPTDTMGDSQQPTQFVRVTLPIPNPNIQGHTAPNTLWMGHQLLSALEPETYHPFPRWNAAQEGWETVDGDFVTDRDEVNSMRKAITGKVHKSLVEFYNNPSLLEGCIFFGYTKVDYKGDKEYVNVKPVSQDEAEAEGVEYEGFIEE
jgi:hypothetical protein